MSNRIIFCRLIQDPPASGTWNMAVDQAILEHTIDRPTLRIYRWQPATLSLGYFQKYEDRKGHEASRHAPCVRRASGGGAIMHDREITYSLSMPLRNRRGREHANLYNRVHRALIRALREWNIGAELCGDRPDRDLQPKGSADVPNDNPFLCFQRRTEGDVIIGQYKVIGSAQRRGRQALLQHGSILMHRSQMAPELPGINDLGPQSVDESTLITCWLDQLAEELYLQFEPDDIKEAEIATAEVIEKDRFGNDLWTRKR